jgi:hypothetical protein
MIPVAGREEINIGCSPDTRIDVINYKEFPNNRWKNDAAGKK